MAKAKISLPLTPEEKLTAALVPENEQPYHVPFNWCWVRMCDVFHINPKNIAEDNIMASFIPMDKISAGLLNKFTYDVKPWGKIKKGHTQFADGDVAFAKISPCFENRKSMILSGLKNGVGAGTTELIILRQPKINSKFTFWFITSEEFIRKGINTYSGTVGQQRISMDFVKTYPIPLPPFAEQQRIVERIESLFAKLDRAAAKARSVLATFEPRKAAVLHRAFTGELTRKWREKNGIAEDSWEEKKLGELCDNISYGYTAKATNNNYYPKMLRISDIQNNYVNWETVPNCEVNDENLEKFRLLNGDIVFARTGATTGKSYLIEYPPCSVYASYLIRIRLDDTVNKYYIYYFLQSDFYWNQISDMSVGIAQPGVNANKLQNLNLMIPMFTEQKEIVGFLDSFFAKEKQAQKLAEQTLERIDLIKKAILARAFRGKLGTNKPEEASCVAIKTV